jgi:hypothetical protein
MSRLKLLLAILFLAALTPALRAQNRQIDEFAWQDVYTNANLDTRPPAPWVAERTLSPKFPVLVLLQQQNIRYHWFDNTFFGTGLAHFYSPVGQTVNFKYDCGVTFDRFRPTEFHARWVHHDTQLQILLRKPGSERTTTCNIKPALPVQQASSQPPQAPHKP